ncbi:MAG: hypothetical protein AAF762_11360 [Pseudomonadota bacterium]
MSHLAKTVMGGRAALPILAAPTTAAAERPTRGGVKERGTVLCSGHNGNYFGLVEVNDQNEGRASTSTCAVR